MEPARTHENATPAMQMPKQQLRNISKPTNCRAEGALTESANVPTSGPWNRVRPVNFQPKLKARKDIFGFRGRK